MLTYYRDDKIPLFEIKRCSTASQSKQFHFHSEVSIAVISSGSTTVSYNNTEYTFKANDLLLIPPQLVHNCIPYDSSEWHFSMIMIDSEWFHDYFQYKSDEILQHSLNPESMDFFHAGLTALEKEPADQKERILIEFIESLFKLFNENANTVLSTSIFSSKAEKVKEYIDNHFREKLRLNDLADLVGVNRYYLARSFKKCYNISPLLYQRNIRFNYAKEELKKNVSLIDLALDLGYYDQSHFTNDFTAFTGTSPGEYKT
jgi:AraC-like DNA-binding protein